jgi:Domain of Unknown Function (DUF1543)
MELYQMETPKLFMIMLGCTPEGRHTEQHDVFFGIANKLEDLKEDILNFWPEVNGKIHIDAWQEVNYVNDYFIKPALRSSPVSNGELPQQKLFFLNLGGYKQNEFDEYHYKLLAVAPDQSSAIRQAKQTAFFKHFDAPGAHSHIDDKYGVDVDDLYNVEDILPLEIKTKYRIDITPKDCDAEDEIHIGYLKLSKL